MWQRMGLTLSGWLEVLTRRSETYQKTLNHLGNLERIWTTTLAEARDSKAPEFIYLNIDNTTRAIHASQTGLKEQLYLVLDLQSMAGKEIVKCENMLNKIADIQQNTISAILIQDSLPVWSPKWWLAGSRSLKNNKNTVTWYGKNLKNTLFKPSRYNLLLGAIFTVLLFLFVTIRNRTRKWAVSGDDFSLFVRVFDYPVVAALTVSLLIVTTPYRSPFPVTVRGTLQVLSLLPLIILVRPEISSRFRPLLYTLGLLFLLDAIRDVLFTEQLTGQLFLIFESIGSIVVMLWVRHKLRTLSDNGSGPTVVSILRKLTFPVLLLLASGFFAAVSGHVGLARIITPGIISFSVMAMAMYVALRILIGFVAFAFQVWPLNMFHMVQRHRPMLEKRIYRLLLWAAATGLIVRYLGYIGILELALSTGTTVLSTTFVFGTLSITIAEVVYPALIVWVTYVLSSFIRFVLWVWTECIDDVVRVRSELAEAVFDAVRGAGLTFPFPQCEVRLLNDSKQPSGPVEK
jgi:hypothetical protein